MVVFELLLFLGAGIYLLGRLARFVLNLDLLETVVYQVSPQNARVETL